MSYLSKWKSCVVAGAMAVAAAGQAAALEMEWGDLHARCEAAVMAGERLNVAGLQQRLPNFTNKLVDNGVFGKRLEREPLGPGGRALPTGIWGSKGGRLELWLYEYPTRAGFRAICEVRQGRNASHVTEAEAAQLRALFFETSAVADGNEIAIGNPDLSAFRFDDVNARGCPLVTSFSADAKSGYLRSSISEAAGAPNCGGPSLARDVITPHGVLPPNVQGG